MLEFIQLLKQRYQSVLSQVRNDSLKTIYQQRIDQLILAEAFIRKGQLLASSPEPPLQITVVGPTQAGKSSLVNVLLNSNAAAVSPLAGYTIHPQGFCNKVSLSDCSGLQRYFGRFQQLQQAQLTKDRHDCYSLTENTTD
jgi:ribosome biogenesis GTPase A